MGCFSIFPCFSSSKHPKLNKSVNPTTPSSSSSADQGCKKNRQTVLFKVPTEESTNIGSLQTPSWKSRDNSDCQVIKDSDSKKFAIDLDVENNKDVEILSAESEERREKKVKEGCGKLGVLVQLENAEERDDVKNKKNGKLGVLEQVVNERKNEKQNYLGVLVEIENDNKIQIVPEEENKIFGVHMEAENESDREKEGKTEVHNGAISDSSVSSYISYPPMHRYHNHVIDEDEDQAVIQEDSSESLFSLSVDRRRQSKSCPFEVDDKEVNSPLKTSSSPKMTAKSTSSFPNENDYNQTIDCLMNPIENLAQWKTLKAMPPTPSLDLHQEKENFYLEQDIHVPISEDPSFEVSDHKGKVKNNTAVTTSLSSWLVNPEKSITVRKEESQLSAGNSYTNSDGATSWKSFEDRPILGAWTIDEVKQISARSSPRKSPIRNPDETPIIGTVGSYWSHTMQATDSSSSCTSPFGTSIKSRRNRENKPLSCHSSPTKRRLERAFNKSAV